jgi:hypothetical protein
MGTTIFPEGRHDLKAGAEENAQGKGGRDMEAETARQSGYAHRRVGKGRR